jgi:hypothetical protein
MINDFESMVHLWFFFIMNYLYDGKHLVTFSLYKTSNMCSSHPFLSCQYGSEHLVFFPIQMGHRLYFHILTDLEYPS